MRLLPNIIKTDDYFIAPPKNEYEKRGQRIVDKAKKEADKIIESAKAEADKKVAIAKSTAESITRNRYLEIRNAILNDVISAAYLEIEKFSDEKYFMKLFLKKENVTPTQYRNSYFRTHINNK